MRQTLLSKAQEEWLKVLGKGMITIPKNWREELGLTEGEVVKAKKIGNRVILEGKQELAPYRIFSDEEIEEWLREDRLSKLLQEKVERIFKSLKGV